MTYSIVLQEHVDKYVVCPYCGRHSVIYDSETHEYVCTRCGTVIDSRPIMAYSPYASEPLSFEEEEPFHIRILDSIAKALRLPHHIYSDARKLFLEKYSEISKDKHYVRRDTAVALAVVVIYTVLRHHSIDVSLDYILSVCEDIDKKKIRRIMFEIKLGIDTRLGINNVYAEKVVELMNRLGIDGDKKERIMKCYEVLTKYTSTLSKRAMLYCLMRYGVDTKKLSKLTDVSLRRLRQIRWQHNKSHDKLLRRFSL